MARAQVEIGQRTFSEVLRLFDKLNDARNALEMTSKQLLYDWMSGCAPSAKYLQRLCYMGADIEYILTGRRSKK